MEITTHEEMLDKYVGAEGTEKRIAYDEKLNRHSIGWKLTSMRKYCGLNKSQVQKPLDKPSSWLSRLENGVLPGPTKEDVEILSNFYTAFLKERAASWEEDLKRLTEYLEQSTK